MAEVQSLNTSEEASELPIAHSFLYKNTGKGPQLSQQQRRELLLEEQIQRRHTIVDRHRDFTELYDENETIDQEMEKCREEYPSELVECSEDMETETDYYVMRNIWKRKRKSKKYCDFSLMLSEWFSEVPSDLEDNWLVKLAPEGTRVLVLARNNSTYMMIRGATLCDFPSNLPGGGLQICDCSNAVTALDGIYHKGTRTIFILDCLHWNKMSLVEHETTFRFYWLDNIFKDNPNLIETESRISLSLLPSFPAEKPIIQDKLHQKFTTTSGEEILLNGLVFYHKEANYVFTITPLFGWLFCYMVPEKLGIDVPQELMDKKPEGYESVEKSFAEWFEKQCKKWESGRFKEKKEKKIMDISEDIS
ncbi:snurportin-1 [Euwallacea similis]|uniref:snurportin-1 n=1 Tax=Euwallacea similis TaxID=1736056 RepID=UPI00344B937E